MFVFDDDEGLGVPILEPVLNLIFVWNRSKKKTCPFWSLFFCKRRAHFGAFFLPKGINS